MTGKYCETSGASNVTGECQEGWYSPENSTTATQSKCFPGQYCPVGSLAPTACTPGMYCDKAELAAPYGNCSESYFCANGSTSATPDGSDDTGMNTGYFKF